MHISKSVTKQDPQKPVKNSEPHKSLSLHQQDSQKSRDLYQITARISIDAMKCIVDFVLLAFAFNKETHNGVLVKDFGIPHEIASVIISVVRNALHQAKMDNTVGGLGNLDNLPEKALVRIGSHFGLHDSDLHSNNLDRVKNALQDGILIYARGKHGDTALHDADSEELILFLIENGLDVNATNAFGATALFYAKTPNIAQLLLDVGAELKTVDLNNKTVLHSSKNAAMTQFFIEQGVNINAKCNINLTALSYARDIETAKVLLDAGIDISEKMIRFSFMHFYSSGAYSDEFFKYLSANGVKLDMSNRASKNIFFAFMFLLFLVLLVFPVLGVYGP